MVFIKISQNEHRSILPTDMALLHMTVYSLQSLNFQLCKTLKAICCLHLHWNPFLTTSRIVTTVATTTDLQIPGFSFI